MDWNEAQKSNGDREYCLTVDDRLILCELQTVLQPDQSELVGSEQPHLSLLPLIITDVKHATKSVMCESESVASLKVLIQQCLPYRTGRRRRRRNLLCIGKTNNTNSDVTTSTKVLCRAARIAETITGSQVDPSEQQDKFDSLVSHTRAYANATLNEQWPVKYEMTTQKRLKFICF